MPPELSSDPGVLWRSLSVAGMLGLVVAYLLNQRGYWKPDSVRYLLCNVVGSGLLALYSVVIGEWVFVGLEGFWCLASVNALRAANSGGAAGDASAAASHPAASDPGAPSP